MAPPKTRSQKGLVEKEEQLAHPKDSIKAKSQTDLANANELQRLLDENRELKERLEDLKGKYSEKKRSNKELRQTVEQQEKKIVEQDNYIAKLRKDRKRAEQVHKSNVSSLITASAQNQALMTVLTTQQQSVQHILQPQLVQNLSSQQTYSNGMFGLPQQPSYSSVGYNFALPLNQYHLQQQGQHYSQKYENFTSPTPHLQ